MLGQNRLTRHCLLVCLSLTAATSAAEGATLLPIPTQSGWVTFKDIEEKGDFKIFRRYGVINETLRNMIMFNCSKDFSKAASHLTFVLPKEFHPDSFPRSTWLPKIEVRVLIDDRLSVLMPAEYRDGELFADLNTDTQENFEKLMLADTLAIGLGGKNDIIQYHFTDKIDAMFTAFIQDTGSKFGEMTHYSRAGAGSVAESRKAYQQSGRQSGERWKMYGTLSCPDCDPSRGETASTVEDRSATSREECVKLLRAMRKSAELARLNAHLQCTKLED
jgi:hypothetical protein